MAHVAIDVFTADEDETGQSQKLWYSFSLKVSLIAFLHASVIKFIPEDINVFYLCH